MKRSCSFALCALLAVPGVAAAAPDDTPIANQQASGPERVDPPQPDDELAEVERTAGPVATPAEPALTLATPLGGVEVYGHVVGSYSRNLADPGARRDANALRLSDRDHDTFSPTSAKLGLRKRLSGMNELDAGFRLELQAGRLVETALADDGLFDDEPIDLAQAYAEVQLATPWGKPVSMKAGRWAFMFGGESLDLPDNPSFSTGYLAAFGPKTVTGAGLTFQLAPGLSYEQFVCNGWDVVDDPNDAKTVGGLLVYELAMLKLRAGWLLGAEGAGTGDHRWAVTLDMVYRPTSRTELYAAFVYGEEEGGDVVDGGLARFGGIGLGAKQGLIRLEGDHHDFVSVYARGEVFRDAGGSRTGERQDLAQVTAGLELEVIQGAAIRMEYRYDWSTEKVFGGSSGPAERDEQQTLGLSVHYRF